MKNLSNNEKNYNKSDPFSNILAQCFLKDCMSVALLNFQTGKAWVLKCDVWPELLGQEYEWHELVQRYVQKRVFMQDERSTLALSLENIKAGCMQNGGTFQFETRIICGDSEFKWVEITINVVEKVERKSQSTIELESTNADMGEKVERKSQSTIELESTDADMGEKVERKSQSTIELESADADMGYKDEEMAIVRICDIDEAILIRKIMELFVYQNYDYLLLIDSKKDSYIRFTGGKGSTPLPPERGEHYSQDMIRYNKQYVMPEDYQRVMDNMQLSNVMQKLEKNDTYSFTSRGLTTDGRYRQSRVTFVYSDKPSGLILCARTDVTQIYLEEQEKKQKLEEALRNAQNDPLTGIYNQKATAMLVARSLETRYRNMATLFFIDVDNFKMINDTYGHQKGDELLYFVAQRLRELGGREGIAGRLGGDEYLLYMSSVRSLNDIEKMGQSVCRIFDLFPDDSVDKKLLSCSVGISVYPQDGTDYETLVRKADQALYTSKRYGKNRFYFFSCQKGSR